MALLDDAELTAIRELGESGMTTLFVIKRASVITTDHVAYDAAYDYGDDELTDFDPVYQTEDEVTQVSGWLVSRLVSDPTTGQGQLATVDLHTLRLPVGTDIRPNDIAARVDNGAEYVVIDTNSDDTWPEWLKANVRRRE
jgi:V8-like Glu-specific endopeptidase